MVKTFPLKKCERRLLYKQNQLQDLYKNQNTYNTHFPKEGKWSYKIISEKYALEYGTAEIEIHEEAIFKVSI